MKIIFCVSMLMMAGVFSHETVGNTDLVVADQLLPVGEFKALHDNDAPSELTAASFANDEHTDSLESKEYHHSHGPKSDKYVKITENGIEIFHLTYFFQHSRFVNFQDIEYFILQNGRLEKRVPKPRYQIIRNVYWAPNDLLAKGKDNEDFLYINKMILKVKGKPYRLGFFLENETADYLLGRLTELNIQERKAGFFFR